MVPHFDPNDRRMTVDDILFTNNSNIIAIDQETTDSSIANQKFMVRCHYRMPRNDLDASTSWSSQIVSWKELTIDLSLQQAV